MNNPRPVVERVVTLPGWEIGEQTGPAGTGVYAAFATWYGRRVVRLEHHLLRLQESARRVGLTTTVDGNRLRSALADLLDESGFAEAKVRVTLVEPPAVDTGARPPAYLVVRMEAYDGPPVALREAGVACGLLRGISRETPEAKRADWIEKRSRASEASGMKSPPVYEWLLTDEHGLITEGASSNFYLIVPGQDGEPLLMTAGSNILHGTARAIVLEVAPDILPVRLEAPGVEDLTTASEAFISSASRGIVPVVRIDDRLIGSGGPGGVTLRLIRAYEERAEQLAVPLRPVAE